MAHYTTIVSDTTNLASQIRVSHNAASSAARDALRHAIECGRLLHEAKSTIGHGHWLGWVKSNCDFSNRTAQAYMRLYDRRDAIQSKAQPVAHLGVRAALKEIAEPSQNPFDQLATTMESARPKIEALKKTNLEDATLAELAQVVADADCLRNVIAEKRLRADRYAGELMNELMAILPRNGRTVLLFPEENNSRWGLIVLAPSTHEGYYYACAFDRDVQGHCLGSVEGTKRPLQEWAAIRWLGDRLGNQTAKRIELEPGEDDFALESTQPVAPWTYNKLLFASRDESTRHTVGSEGAE